mmetsp:Transcript_23709/g.60517  ORF Transcript_23709/g.60517 Transcript_23709/m.60517 type:complete len:82 (+) Transcript_23709:3-248(+)
MATVKLTDLAPAGQRGITMGYATTAEQCGRVVMPIALSAAYEFGDGASLAYLIAAAVMFLCGGAYAIALAAQRPAASVSLV